MRTFCIFIIQKGCSWIKKIYLKNFNWMFKLNSSFTDWQVCKEIAEKKYRRQFYNDITLWLFTQNKNVFYEFSCNRFKTVRTLHQEHVFIQYAKLGVHQTMQVIDTKFMASSSENYATLSYIWHWDSASTKWYLILG